MTPNEGGALSLLEGKLKAAGFSCRRLVFSAEETADVDNLYARVGDKGPCFCFAGHTDVVPVGDAKAWSVDPFGGEIVDGKLYGRGTSDMKAGIVSYVTAFKALRLAGLQPAAEVQMQSVIEEECTGNGALAAMLALASPATAADCPRADALGTSRVLKVDAATTPAATIALMKFMEGSLCRRSAHRARLRLLGRPFRSGRLTFYEGLMTVM